MNNLKSESIYILEFEGGLFKVGRSVEPKLRIKAHESSVYSISGNNLNRHFIIDTLGSAVFAEKIIIEFCAKKWIQRSREWFLNADYLELIEFAKTAVTLKQSKTKRKKKEKSYTRNRTLLTRDIIDSFECYDGLKERYIYDSIVPELGVRAYASGKKSFICRYTKEGKSMKKTLASASIGLDEAREKVRVFLNIQSML